MKVIMENPEILSSFLCTSFHSSIQTFKFCHCLKPSDNNTFLSISRYYASLSKAI